QIRADEIHLDGLYPRRYVVFLQGSHRPRNPRIVDQNVNGRKLLNGMAHHVLHLRWVGDIYWHNTGEGSQGAPRPRNPRIVDQNVNGRKLLNGMAHHVLHLRWVGDIYWHNTGEGPQG